MMFANAGVIYKALGIPVNSFTVMFAMGFRFFEAKKGRGVVLEPLTSMRRSCSSRWRCGHRTPTHRLRDDDLLRLST